VKGALISLLGALVVSCSGCGGGGDGQTTTAPPAQAPAPAPVAGAQIVPTAQVTYRDGRPSVKYRLPSQDAGVVLKHGDPQDVNGARDVYVYQSGTMYYMMYDGSSVNAWLANLATSTDLTHWTKKGAVLQLGAPGTNDSGSASYGTAYYDGQAWNMFYLGTPNTTGSPDYIPAFPYTTMKAKSASPDGPWVKQPSVTPFSPQPGTYMSVTASPGQIEKINGQYWMFFSAAAGDTGDTKRTIGLAQTSNLDGTWMVGASPLLPPSEQLENAAMYYQPSTGTWFMFVNHVGIGPTEGIGEYTDAVWVYWTQDPAKWNPDNKAVVVDNTSQKWSKTIVGLPSVVQMGNRLAVFYDGAADGSASHMNRDVGLAWVDLPINTPRQ